ncbi:unnamed protein product, partial [Sphagnum jensenii]
TIIGLEHVWAIGVDLVPGAKTLHLIKEFGLSGETLFAGLVDGRNIWANDLAVSVTVIEEFRQALGKVRRMKSSPLIAEEKSLYEPIGIKELATIFALKI